jgi:hypothetical protein
MSSSSSSSGYLAIPRCPVIFDGANYPNFTAFMRVHMRGLRLWGVLSGEVPCPPLTKHIGVDAFYTRAQVQAQVVALQYVPSDLQLADFFTKAQTRAQHDFLLSKLSVVDPP